MHLIVAGESRVEGRIYLVQDRSCVRFRWLRLAWDGCDRLQCDWTPLRNTIDYYCLLLIAYCLLIIEMLKPFKDGGITVL